MQNGDRETQPKVDVVMPTEESKDPAAVELCATVAATEFEPCVTTQPPGVASESVPQLSDRARMRSRIESIWRRLREQRREAAAVVVLIVIAMVWFDSGSSGTGTASNSPNQLDSYDTLLSDFERVADDEAMRESSDPFETSHQNSIDSGLYSPQTEGSFQTETFSTKNTSADSGRSTPTTTARYPDTASAFKASAAQTSADYGFGQQQPRKVKFAGRIQPAN